MKLLMLIIKMKALSKNNDTIIKYKDDNINKGGNKKLKIIKNF